MKKPFFSVVIPTYNRANLLLRPLSSLLKQTFKDFEVIIVDDGSTDKTKDMVKKYKGFKYFKTKHQGAAKAKNFGISKAKGEYITFLDSDDKYLPSHLEIRKTVIKKNPKAGFFYGGFKTIGNKYVRDFFKPGKMVHVNKIVIGGTFVANEKLFKKIGKFKNINYGEDTELFYRAKMKQVAIKKVSSKTYIYYR